MPKPAKAVKKISVLADLTPDSMNPNSGTDRGRQLVDWSLTELGAGRSILIDRSGNVIAGNKTLEAATAHNLPLRVIETDGSELVAVQRVDLDLFGEDDEERQTARQLSIVDNEANLAGYQRDAEMLLTHEASGVDLSPIIPAAEVEALKATLTPFDASSLDGMFVPNTDAPKEETEKIVLEFTPEQAEDVRFELAKHGKTNEAAVLALLGL